MKKIVAIAGSNSKKSINKKLASYAAQKTANAEAIVADLNDFNLPLYSIDTEQEGGIPSAAHDLNNLIASADGIVVSLAEHNGSYAAAFKSAYDWVSRIDMKVWKDKPMLLMATSPGPRGGASVLATAKAGFPYAGAQIVADFSLPSFFDNFSEAGISNSELSAKLDLAIVAFEKAI